ncbi:MAG: hypothetical protein Q4G35_01270 [Propionibacteriaceae bacterium]|nr:hypothetical protein [Propionibacteriaceae bacterium]
MSATPTAITAWEAADRRQDLALMKAQLAPGVQLISPLTDQFTFNGPDEVMAVFESAFVLLRDIVVHKVTGAEQDWVLWGTNTLRGKNLEEVQWLHLDDDGLIDQITLFIRPVAAAAELLAHIGPPMAKRGLMGRRWARVAAFLGLIPSGQLRSAERFIMPRLR